MGWKAVGQWLKKNGTGLVGLAGAVATGNVPAGVAAVTSMVSEATGTHDAAEALLRLQTDPATMVRLEELAKQGEVDIRQHHREMLRLELEDAQREHTEQQTTIRSGDNSADEYVRRTRPLAARQSWYATMGYVIGFELMKVLEFTTVGATLELAAVLCAPAAAYMGFRTWEKRKGAIK